MLPINIDDVCLTLAPCICIGFECQDVASSCHSCSWCACWHSHMMVVCCPGSLCNKVERRLQQCLPYLAKSLSKLVVNSENADLQTHACQLMSCDIHGLQQELELRLQARSYGLCKQMQHHCEGTLSARWSCAPAGSADRVSALIEYVTNSF